MEAPAFAAGEWRFRVAHEEGGVRFAWISEVRRFDEPKAPQEHIPPTKARLLIEAYLARSLNWAASRSVVGVGIGAGVVGVCV